jgi:hypothetical protein
MAIPTLKTVRRTLTVVAAGLVLAPIFWWPLSLWAERQFMRAYFDRIEIGASFQDVMDQMKPFRGQRPYTAGFDWEAISKVRSCLPGAFGTANVGVTVYFDVGGRPSTQWRVFHKQYHQKSARTVFRERWQAAFGAAPPF